MRYQYAPWIFCSVAFLSRKSGLRGGVGSRVYRRRPERYGGKMGLQNGEISIYWEFVGTTFLPVSADGKQWNDADVYTVMITGEKTETETIPVIYRGGRLVIVDRPNLRVVLSQKDSEPRLAPAPDSADAPSG